MSNAGTNWRTRFRVMPPANIAAELDRLEEVLTFDSGHPAYGSGGAWKVLDEMLMTNMYAEDDQRRTALASFVGLMEPDDEDEGPRRACFYQLRSIVDRRFMRSRIPVEGHEDLDVDDIQDQLTDRERMTWVDWDLREPRDFSVNGQWEMRSAFAEIAALRILLRKIVVAVGAQGLEAELAAHGVDRRLADADAVDRQASMDRILAERLTPLWAVSEDRLVIEERSGEYEVPLSSDLTRRGALEWVAHVAEKQWATKDHLRQLARLLVEWTPERVEEERDAQEEEGAQRERLRLEEQRRGFAKIGRGGQ